MSDFFSRELVNNTDDFLKSILRAFSEKFPISVGIALEKEAKRIMQLSDKKAPRDTGALIASGKVGEAMKDANGVYVEFGYGVSYAIPVHERTEGVQHKNGEAKFLEKAMLELAPGAGSRIAAEIANSVVEGALGRMPGPPAPLTFKLSTAVSRLRRAHPTNVKERSRAIARLRRSVRPASK